MEENLEQYYKYYNTLKNIDFLYYRVPFKFNLEKVFELNINDNVRIIRGDNYNNDLKTKEILNPYIQVFENNKCVLFKSKRICNQKEKYIPGEWEDKIDEYIKQLQENTLKQKNKVFQKKI